MGVNFSLVSCVKIKYILIVHQYLLDKNLMSANILLSILQG